MFGGVSNFWSSLDIRWFIIKQRARDLDISTCDASGGEWGVRSKVEEDLTLIPRLLYVVLSDTVHNKLVYPCFSISMCLCNVYILLINVVPLAFSLKWLSPN